MISVIGGSGFIGTSLCKKLEKEELEFIILDRIKSIIETKAFNTGFKPPIKLENAIDYTINEEFLKR
jgi:NAD dependent epimerase/dehydratase family enzyme